jgi:hypothetical protein
VLVALHRLVPGLFCLGMNRFGRGKVSKKDQAIVDAHKKR